MLAKRNYDSGGSFGYRWLYPFADESVSFIPDGGSAEAWCIIDVYGADVTTDAYSDPSVSWEVSGNDGNDGRGFTWYHKISVTSPTADWNTSRGCTSECATGDAVTNATDSQWIYSTAYEYNNVGKDTGQE